VLLRDMETVESTLSWPSVVLSVISAERECEQEKSCFFCEDLLYRAVLCGCATSINGHLTYNGTWYIQLRVLFLWLRVYLYCEQCEVGGARHESYVLWSMPGTMVDRAPVRSVQGDYSRPYRRLRT